jgi:phi LC3 family holin
MFQKQRFKNYALWVSVASQFLLLVQLIGHLTGAFNLTDVMRQDILTILDVILGILCTLGIISNPTKPRSGGYNL